MLNRESRHCFYCVDRYPIDCFSIFFSFMLSIKIENKKNEILNGFCCFVSFKRYGGGVGLGWGGLLLLAIWHRFDGVALCNN